MKILEYTETLRNRFLSVLRGRTAERVADAVGVTAPTLRLWMRGEKDCTIPTLEKIETWVEQEESRLHRVNP